MRRIALVLIALVLLSCKQPPAAQPTLPATGAVVIVEPVATVEPVQRVEMAVIPAVTAEVCTVETGYENGTVNVRAGAGMQYEVIDVVQQGEQMVMTGPEIEGWRHVTTSKLVEGWFYVLEWCK